MKWWEWVLGFFMVGLIGWIVTLRYQPTMEFEDRCGPDKQEVRQCVPDGIDYG